MQKEDKAPGHQFLLSKKKSPGQRGIGLQFENFPLQSCRRSFSRKFSHNNPDGIHAAKQLAQRVKRFTRPVDRLGMYPPRPDGERNVLPGS